MFQPDSNDNDDDDKMIIMTINVKVREKEEAWRKYKDAVEEGKTAGVVIIMTVQWGLLGLEMISKRTILRLIITPGKKVIFGSELLLVGGKIVTFCVKLN